MNDPANGVAFDLRPEGLQRALDVHTFIPDVAVVITVGCLWCQLPAPAVRNELRSLRHESLPAKIEYNHF